MSFIEQMAELDRRRGRAPINSTHIEGFGPDAPPAPTMPPGEERIHIPSAIETYGEPVEIPEPVVNPTIHPSSPLIDAAKPRDIIITNRILQAVDKEPTLWVKDEQAIYRGRLVELTAAEMERVSQVVLKALRRSLDEQYQEISGKKPRARRTTSSSTASPTKSTGTPRSRERKTPRQSPGTPDPS